jgi:hypothetical protein
MRSIEKIARILLTGTLFLVMTGPLTTRQEMPMEMIYLRTDTEIYGSIQKVVLEIETRDENGNPVEASLLLRTGTKNAYTKFFRSEDGKLNGYRLSVFGQPIPTVTYNFRF